MRTGPTLRERRDQMVAAVGAVDGLGGELWRASSADLEAVMGEADRMVAAGEAARVLVLAEAMSRGETGAGPAALTPVQWVRAHAPSTRGGGAVQVVTVATAFSVPGRAAVKDAVLSGELPVRSAAVVLAEADRLAPLLAEGVEPAVVDGLVEMAVRHGPRGCRMLRPRLLAEYGLDGELQRDEDAAKRFVSLSQPRIDAMGMAEYRMVLDPEGRAVLEAALGPLSAPRPVEGERDLRCSDRRRAEALITLVRRAVERAEAGPRHTKCQLFVTVGLDALRDGLRGAGVAMGGPEAGTLLAPQTVRRLACDATIIPTVLGVAGAVLDQGMDVRLFTAAQVKRLWLRDQHCTYPGCDMPAHWTDAHHLTHWADGGPTDLSNAALLCERHHTIVHTRRYAGALVQDATGPRVQWDLTVGSYDRALATQSAREPA
ncbi:hypothetical protein GCM10023168_02150 [Fodinibacter luteus]|uniref:HNH nuclease domain-containing protein n=1 Tax=Fodinibacter luteus TaxID=552064 RepID=A0ABP8JXX4_9MICO